jgi:hypothetical protein
MQIAIKRIPSAAFAFAAVLSWSCGACATDAWQPVSNADLDELRGGFDAGAGLRISFGVEREGYVNGKLISSTSFNIAEALRTAAGSMTALPATVIRNGVPAIAQARPVGLLIQNSLDLQDIRSLTVINATTNSLDLVKSLQLQSALADALVHSLGRR